jgi:predicted negative regulator of RcsB-dependent stress response
MSTYDLEEQERISALKDWWDKWGMWVQVALAAFVVGMLGVQGWRYYQKNEAEQAEAVFKSVQKTAQETAAGKDGKKLSEAATAMADKYPGSFYSTQAQLMAAKVAFETKDFTAAKGHLQWVADKGRESHRNVARVRLAGVLLEEKKYDDALKVLDGVKEESFLQVAADMKGDVYAAQGRADEARAAYQIAVDKADPRSSMKVVSQAKLDAFGGAIEVKKEDDPKTAAKDDKGAGK